MPIKLNAERALCWRAALSAAAGYVKVERARIEKDSDRRVREALQR